MTNKPHEYAMHSNTSEENIHATQYLQEKLVVFADVDVLLLFLALPCHFFPKDPSMRHYPSVLQDNSKC